MGMSAGVWVVEVWAGLVSCEKVAVRAELSNGSFLLLNRTDEDLARMMKRLVDDFPDDRKTLSSNLLSGLLRIRAAEQSCEPEVKILELNKLLRSIIHLPQKFSQSEVVLDFFRPSAVDQIFKVQESHHLKQENQTLRQEVENVRQVENQTNGQEVKNQTLRQEVENIRQAENQTNGQEVKNQTLRQEVENIRQEVDNQTIRHEVENQTLRQEVENIRQAENQTNGQEVKNQILRQEVENIRQEVDNQTIRHEVENQTVMQEEENIRQVENQTNGQEVKNQSLRQEVEKIRQEVETQTPRQDVENQTLKQEVENIRWEVEYQTVELLTFSQEEDEDLSFFQSPAALSEVLRSNGFCLANTETVVVDLTLPTQHVSQSDDFTDRRPSVSPTACLQLCRPSVSPLREFTGMMMRKLVRRWSFKQGSHSFPGPTPFTCCSPGDRQPGLSDGLSW